MQKTDERMIAGILAHGVWGSFAGMVMVGSVLWWDISGIATMLSAADHNLLANLFLGGAMMKGALLGMVVGSGRAQTVRETARAHAFTPAMLSQHP